MAKKLAPVHPGEVLLEEFLTPLELSQFWLNLQARYDLETERDRLGARLQSEVRIFAAAS